MEDLVRDGRKVHLAVGPAPRSPRKYRGRDATDWLYDMGHYAITIDQHPDPAKALTQTNHYMSGRGRRPKRSICAASLSRMESRSMGR